MPRMSSKGYAPIAARAGTESPINVHFAKIDGHHHPTLTLSRPRPPVPPRYYYKHCLPNGASFGKSQLLNAPTLANQNKNKKARNLNTVLFHLGTLHLQVQKAHLPQLLVKDPMV